MNVQRGVRLLRGEGSLCVEVGGARSRAESCRVYGRTEGCGDEGPPAIRNDKLRNMVRFCYDKHQVLWGSVWTKAV